MNEREMFYGAHAGTFANAKNLREQMTDAERALWEQLSENKLDGFKFRRQHPIGQFIADFYCHQAKLVIEVDGGVHNIPDNKEYDQGRDFVMKELGLNVLRFTNAQVLKDVDTVLAEIRSKLLKKDT